MLTLRGKKERRKHLSVVIGAMGKARNPKDCPDQHITAVFEVKFSLREIERIFSY